MEKFFEKFNRYDMLAFIIPGSAALAIIGFILKINGYNALSYICIDNVVICTVSLFIASYLLGILLHEFSEILQSILAKIWGGMPSFKYYSFGASDSFISSKENLQYKELAKEKFGIDIKDETTANLFFQRACVYIKGHSCNTEIEVINSIYGLCRTLFALFILTFLFFLFCTITDFKLLNIFFTLMFFLFSMLFARRTERFGKTYVKKVLRAYYQCIKEE